MIEYFENWPYTRKLNILALHKCLTHICLFLLNDFSWMIFLVIQQISATSFDKLPAPPEFCHFYGPDNVIFYQILTLFKFLETSYIPLENSKYIIYMHESDTAQKMKFSFKDFFGNCDQIRRKLRIWSHLLKKPLMEKFIFCAVWWKMVNWRGLRHIARELSNITQKMKSSFLLRITSVNEAKSTVSCGFGHIYWRNSQRKTSFFVQCKSNTRGLY